VSWFSEAKFGHIQRLPRLAASDNIIRQVMKSYLEILKSYENHFITGYVNAVASWFWFPSIFAIHASVRHDYIVTKRGAS